MLARQSLHFDGHRRAQLRRDLAQRPLPVRIPLERLARGRQLRDQAGVEDGDRGKRGKLREDEAVLLVDRVEAVLLECRAEVAVRGGHARRDGLG